MTNLLLASTAPRHATGRCSRKSVELVSDRRLADGHARLPPELIIQYELHLISGPLGTVAALYELTIDALASRRWMGHQVRQKLYRENRDDATRVRAALFDRREIPIFPSPGPCQAIHFPP